jgi:nucleolar protein 56
MYLKTRWFGTFLFNEKSIVKKVLFPKSVKEIVVRLEKIEKGEILEEEKKLAGNKKPIICDKRLKPIGEFDPKNIFFKNFEIEPSDFGFNPDIFRKASILLAEKQVENKLQAKDLQIIQMVNSLDELIQISNLISERLECWKMLPTEDEYIRPLDRLYISVKTEISRLGNLIEKSVNEIAPNTSKITGPLITARLISFAGSIERLAYMPASTIQLLGAESALFRFKKEGGKPPKHGIIFQHPYINKSRPQIRGKIARLIATKISIAIKADFFTGRDITSFLEKSIDSQLKKIRNL